MSFLRGLFVGLVLTALGMGSAQAVPMYFTIEGTVDSLTNGDGFYNLGDTISATYLVDTELEGYYTDHVGDIVSVSDYSNTGYSYDYFYVDYLEGTDLGLHYERNHYTEANYGSFYNGVHADGTQNEQTAFVGEDTMTALFYSSFTDIAAGQNSLLRNFWTNSDGTMASAISSNAIVTYIGAENPVASVPEPSTLALMGLGLAGLGFARRKKAH